MSSGDKIINTFQQRRDMAAAFGRLGETETEPELIAAAQAIVHAFPHELVLAQLLKRLDTQSSQMRGGLGYVASLLPAEVATSALRNAVADRRNEPQTRITAGLILERYLGESLPSALMSDLDDNNEVAFQSLQQAVAEGRNNRHILLEYVTQMRQTEMSVASMVMELLERLEPVERVELLRLIAQDDRAPVAEDALRRLDLLATGAAAIEAARALHSLQFVLPPALARLATRGLRKSRLSGTRFTPPDAAGWRALITPIDATQHQLLWLVQTPQRGEATGMILVILVNMYSGVTHMEITTDLPREYLPAARDIGKMVTVNVGNQQPIALLEAPFDYGRHLLLTAYRQNWTLTAEYRIPSEYRLYGDSIWQFAAPEVTPDQIAAMGLPTDDLPAIGVLSAISATLLRHPAMANMAMAPAHRRQLAELVSSSDVDWSALNWADPTQFQRMWLELVPRLEEAMQRERLEAALLQQAGWFHVAGDSDNADRARVVAQSIGELPIEENPFVMELFMRSLRLLLDAGAQ